MKRETWEEYAARVMEALESNTDLWADRIIAAGEASYARIEPLLTPLRIANWADGNWQPYPIVLSDKGSTTKARVLSTGAEIHLNNVIRGEGKYRLPKLAAEILVGENGEPFGTVDDRLVGPKLKDGYLPVTQWTFESKGVRYHQTVFALEERDAGLTVYWKMSSDSPGRVRVRLRGGEGHHVEQVKLYDWSQDTRLLDGENRCAAVFPEGTDYNPDDQTFSFETGPDKPALLAFPNAPASDFAGIKCNAAQVAMAERRHDYRWKTLLGAVEVEVPEEIVNNAWKATLITTFQLANADVIRYSAHNQYEKQYANETGAASLSPALFGHPQEARSYLEFLVLYQPKLNTAYNAASWRLRHMTHYFFLTGDKDFIETNVNDLKSYADFIIDGIRETDCGLIPKEAYAGDHPEIVVSNLRTNCNCWRGMRDLAAALAMVGRKQESDYYYEQCAGFRKAIWDATEKSVVPDGDFDFLPLALFGGEKPFDRVVGTETGNYYSIVMPATLSSWVWPIGHPRLVAFQRYLENKGAMLLGMIRTGRSGPGAWTANPYGLDEPYNIPYAMYYLATGQIDRFLVMFYGKLAHGFTRDTFYGGEGTSLYPRQDEYWRRIALPPNSFSNAFFLYMVRHMLVLETDTNDDSRFDELHLCSATPRAWLEPGKQIKALRMPSGFGEVSVHVKAFGDRIEADFSLKERVAPEKIILTLRLPGGKKIQSVTVNGAAIETFDAETITLPSDARSAKIVARIG